jgi:predicted SnoaL-like aldol condensation-catalyzing enzyme
VASFPRRRGKPRAFGVSLAGRRALTEPPRHRRADPLPVIREVSVDSQLEQHKRVVREWNDLAINQRRPDEAVARYLGPNYRQHNPGAADGPEAFIKFVHWFARTYPDFRVEPKRIIAEDNFVVMHSHLIREPDDRGMAVMDIFRLDEGKIVEHWDVVQEVPETPANDNTMF